MPPTDVVALAAATKSPPAAFQLCVLKNVNSQVTSLTVAGTPSPPPCPVPPALALDVPSPQFCNARCSATACAPAIVRDMLRVNVALVIVEPAGTADKSNLIAPRRIALLFWLVCPTKKFRPAPLLSRPTGS